MNSFYRFNYGGYELSSSEEVSAVDGGTGTAGATGSQATEVSKPVSRLERYLAYKAKQLAERKVSIGVLTSYGERKTKRFGFATVMDKNYSLYFCFFISYLLFFIIHIHHISTSLLIVCGPLICYPWTPLLSYTFLFRHWLLCLI